LAWNMVGMIIHSLLKLLLRHWGALLSLAHQPEFHFRNRDLQSHRRPLFANGSWPVPAMRRLYATCTCR